MDITAQLSKRRGYAFPIDQPTHERRIVDLTMAAIPARFTAAIEASRRLMDLGTDWDDEGAAAIESGTWNRATKFLRTAVTKSGAAAALPVPDISPCRDGSIDLFWSHGTFRLLINIKPNSSGQSDYYGEAKDGFVVKGTFDPSRHDLSAVIQLLLANRKMS